MKKNLVLTVVLLMGLCMFTFSSCDDEKESTGKPIVGLNEVGKENSKTGIAGSDLHLEGEIIAENLIRRIDIEIHQEDGGDFKIEKSFTEGKYIGVKNAHFHEHIEIPSEAPAGKPAFYRYRPVGTDRNQGIGTDGESGSRTHHRGRLEVRRLP